MAHHHLGNRLSTTQALQLPSFAFDARFSGGFEIGVKIFFQFDGCERRWATLLWLSRRCKWSVFNQYLGFPPRVFQDLSRMNVVVALK